MDKYIRTFYKLLPSKIKNSIPEQIPREYKLRIDSHRYRYENAIMKIYRSNVLPSPRIQILDVGASKGPKSQWRLVSELNKLDLTGIEPNKTAYHALQEQYPNHTYHNISFSDSTGRATLYITKEETKSSLYKPNYQLIEKFDMFGDAYNVQNEMEIKSVSMDEFYQDYNYPFNMIKIDTQGSEGDIIQGGKKTINDAHLLLFETHFKELYEGQQTFCDVKSILPNHFEFIDLFHKRWTKSQSISSNSAEISDGELVEGDALYLNTKSKGVVEKIVLLLLYNKGTTALQIFEENKSELSTDQVDVIKRILADI